MGTSRVFPNQITTSCSSSESFRGQIQVQELTVVVSTKMLAHTLTLVFFTKVPAHTHSRIINSIVSIDSNITDNIIHKSH